MSRLMTSAESRLAAISKVVRVRVEFSKNRLKTLLPRSSGTFLTSRSLTLRKVPAVSRMCCRMPARQALDRQQMDQFVVAIELRVAADEHGAGVAVSGSRSVKRPASSRASAIRSRGRQRDPGDRAGGLDRQLAAAAVDQHRQGDARRPAEVVELVDRRADRPPGVEHVVDQDDVPALDLERQLGVAGAGGEAAAGEVVAVQRARDHAGLAGEAAGRAAAARPARRRPTRCRPGPPSALSRPRTPASRPAYSASASSSMRLMSAPRQELLEDQRRGRGVEVARAARHARRWWCSARRPRAPAGRSAPSAGGRSGAPARC